MTAPLKDPRSQEFAAAKFAAADLPAASLALLAEAALVVGAHLLALTLPVIVLCHSLIVVALGLRLFARQRAKQDVGPAALLMVAVAIAGPMGALGGLLIGWLSRAGASDQQRLQAWYDRISLSVETDAVTRLADHVTTGRALDFAAPLPDVFATVLATGTLSQKQAVLGLIARKFHPDYLPALQTALGSDEPVIRVQAAAVAAKIRTGLGALITKLSEQAADPQLTAADARRLLHEVKLCRASGLLEDKDATKASSLSAALAVNVRADTSAAQQTLDTHLTARQDFTALRVSHRRAVWAARGPWRYRPFNAVSGPFRRRLAHRPGAAL